LLAKIIELPEVTGLPPFLDENLVIIRDDIA
jgi:hypothetical protein